MRKLLAVILLYLSLLFFISMSSSAAADKQAAFVFVSAPDNDLYVAALNSGGDYPRFDDPRKAVAAAQADSAVLILADGYPEKTTVVPDDVYETAREKNLHLYMEFPATVPGLTLGVAQSIKWERGVITSDVFGDTLKPMRIVMFHDCRFIPAEAARPLISLAKVAGFDSAVFGLDGTKTWPILFEIPERGLLIATTQLSNFNTGRYAPRDAWPVIWKTILERLQPGRIIPPMEWTSSVGPAFGRDDNLPPDAEIQAVRRGADWYINSRLLVHPDWATDFDKAAEYYDRVGPGPTQSSPAGDGTLGLLEGFSSRIGNDGSQPVRWYRRADCNGETAMALALRSLADGDPRGKTIAPNLLDFIFTKSVLQRGPRAKKTSSSYGLIGWDDTPRSSGIYYGDDNARAILGAIAVSGALKTDRWDEPVAKAILGNFRTSGTLGFRRRNLEEQYLMMSGWKYFLNEQYTDYAPHFQSWIWACYLWMYDKTGYAPLLERTKTGIRMMMAAYPNEWHWTNGMQQERARMLLPLAWLIRVEDTPEHREWLIRISNDLLSFQDASGAIREEIGAAGKGDYGPPRSNDAYGTAEAPLIQENGDPLSDLLYTTNFAFIGLHEAARATGDPKLAAAEDKLAAYLVRIQVRSNTHPELDGAWFRAFDFGRWDYWASNADAGWGAWSIESGWTQGWVVSTLALRQLKTGLWELTSESAIKTPFEEIRKSMIPEKLLK